MKNTRPTPSPESDWAPRAIMRKKLKKRGVNSIKAVYSKKKPAAPCFPKNPPRVPGGTSLAPSSAKLPIASEVVKDIAQNRLR